MVADFGRRLPIDSKMVQEIQSDPQMSQEQGTGFMSDWGSPGAYQYWSRQPLSDRMVFYATQAGYNTPQAIADVTSLKIKDVNKSIGKLTEQGFLAVGEVTASI